MAKKWVFLISLIAFFLIGFVNSAPCTQDELIFKYSATSNAHADLWNSTSIYDYGACYPTIFGKSYIGPNTGKKELHYCQKNSEMFLLKTETNSHAYLTSVPQSTANIGVCYGDLSCEVKEDPLECGPGKKIVARFSGGETNMMVGAPDKAIYPLKLCCDSPSGYPVNWKNATGSTISTARVGDLVYPTARGTSGDFRIYEDDKDTDDEITTIKGSKNGDDWRGIWNIKLEEVKKSELYDYGDFKFSINNQNSNPLEITFCGDNRRQRNYDEECDAGIDNGKTCVGATCSYCDSECKEVFIGATCGNGKIEAKEECDEGLKNNDTCTITAQNTECTYCSKTTCEWQTITEGERIWADLSGKRITKASKGDTVRMFYAKKMAPTPLFEILDNDLLPNLDDLIKKITGTSENDNSVGFWTIPEKSVIEDKTGENDFKEIYFKVDGGNNNKKGEYLELDFEESDEKIKIEVISAKCGEKVMKGDKKMINFTVLDRDDLVKGNITVNGKLLGSFNGPNIAQSHEYDFKDAGTTRIEIYAQNERGDQASSISNIIVLDPLKKQDYVAACVREPTSFFTFAGDHAKFDASTTIAINYDGPNKKETAIQLSALTFKWKFSDKRDYSESGVIGYKFNKYFGTYGNNWADLEVAVK